MPKAIASSAQAPVTENVLRELADLAKVPDEHRSLFFDGVREAVRLVWERREAMTTLTEDISRPLENAASRFYDLLGKLTQGQRELVEGCLAERTCAFDRINGAGGVLEAAYQLADLFCDLTGKSPPRYPHMTAEPRQRGRRPGAVRNWIFQDFVFQLLLYTYEAGGKLTNHKTFRKGTLAQALRLLSPYLPDRFVPKAPPYTTLQRIMSSVKVAEKEAL
jgi:hypothetical protein